MRNSLRRLNASWLQHQKVEGGLTPTTMFRLSGRATERSQLFAESRVVRVGRKRRGFLKPSDERNTFRQGRFADNFQLKGIQAGEQIHIKLNSRSFDTYAQLFNAATGEILLDNNDQRPGVTNSRLTFIAQPDTTYALKVTSFARKETGRYSLRVKAFKPRTGDLSFTYGSGLLDAATAVADVAHLDGLGDAYQLDDPKQWNLNLVNAPAAWSKGFTGKDVVVAVIDSGVAVTHRDLAQNIWTNPREIPNNGKDDDLNGFIDDWRGWDFVQNDHQVGDPNGHGTHISGIIAGLHNDFGVSGVAPDAQIMPVRVLDQNNAGRQGVTAKGIKYAVKNGADIINLSLGGPPGTKLKRRLRKAIKFAYREGVFVAIASGNDRQGYGSTRSGEPAFWASTHNYAMSVGAVDETLQVASYSNPQGKRSSSPYVVAPGSEVYSILPWYSKQTFSRSGTSFATPHVAGVAALMLSANPALSPLEIMRTITESANPEGITAK